VSVLLTCAVKKAFTYQEEAHCWTHRYEQLRVADIR
jgi:hypothetical protein